MPAPSTVSSRLAIYLRRGGGRLFTERPRLLSPGPALLLILPVAMLCAGCGAIKSLVPGAGLAEKAAQLAASGSDRAEQEISTDEAPVLKDVTTGADLNVVMGPQGVSMKDLAELLRALGVAQSFPAGPQPGAWSTGAAAPPAAAAASKGGTADPLRPAAPQRPSWCPDRYSDAYCLRMDAEAARTGRCPDGLTEPECYGMPALPARPLTAGDAISRSPRAEGG